MRAHIIDDEGWIINTINVRTLDYMPGLIDARIGGQIGDRIVNGELIYVATPHGPDDLPPVQPDDTGWPPYVPPPKNPVPPDDPVDPEPEPPVQSGN